MTVIWDTRMDAQTMMPIATSVAVRRFTVVSSLVGFVGASRSAPHGGSLSGERPFPELLTHVW
jgi:hypothetical protein